MLEKRPPLCFNILEFYRANNKYNENWLKKDVGRTKKMFNYLIKI